MTRRRSVQRRRVATHRRIRPPRRALGWLPAILVVGAACLLFNALCSLESRFSGYFFQGLSAAELPVEGWYLAAVRAQNPKGWGPWKNHMFHVGE